METSLKRIENQIAQRGELQEKILQYEKAGFTNCENIRNLRKQVGTINFDRYKEKYPNYLFFTSEEFDEIVKRNKLTISTLETYTGHIPDHCLDAIINENVSIEDVNPTLKFKISSLNKRSTITISNSNYETFELFKSPYSLIRFLREKNYDYNEFLQESSDSGLMWDMKYEIEVLNEEKVNLLYIAAPESMIDNSKKRKSFFQKISFRVEPDPDPIVFRYVKDGILVITFWK
ncbi:MAG: hypothetical protein LBS43_07380 [Prevotellaceae bacterium]|jgi:hypothetical protein|nr:hypothetical protein [Prevotellaceae bacterium]